MNISLSFDDFNARLVEGISVEAIVEEIQRVIGGASVRRAGANIGYEVIEEDGSKRVETLGVELHHELGCMLYYGQGTQRECMLVGDRSRLAQAIENDDGNIQAAGLYVDSQTAIHAIETFCASGHPEPALQWIDVADLPEIDF